MNVTEIKKKAEELKAVYENYLKFKSQKFANTALETTGGETIYINEGDELKVGTPCFHINEAGELTPCEDGEYVLLDGNTIEIVDGIIAEIAASEEEGTESPEETAAPEAETMAEPTNVTDMEDAASGVEERIAALESALEKITEMLQGLMSKQETEMNKLNNKMSKMFSQTKEELNRESSEGIKSKISGSGNIMDEIKDYVNYKGFSKVKTENTEKVHNFNANEMNELMAKARTSPGFGGSFTISN
jgi:hypothetical protein